MKKSKSCFGLGMSSVSEDNFILNGWKKFWKNALHSITNISNNFTSIHKHSLDLVDYFWWQLEQATLTEKSLLAVMNLGRFRYELFWSKMHVRKFRGFFKCIWFHFTTLQCLFLKLGLEVIFFATNHVLFKFYASVSKVFTCTCFQPLLVKASIGPNRLHRSCMVVRSK